MIVDSLRKQASSSPEWPALHVGLLELHAILDDWCRAADYTRKYLELVQRRADRAAVKDAWAGGQGQVAAGPAARLGRDGYLERINKDIDLHLSRRAPIGQRWSRRKRQQAGRRSLRSLMRVYCPDVLAAFEDATTQRSEWIKRNRDTLKRARSNYGYDGPTWRTLMTETSEAITELTAVRDDLAVLIREKFPMGWDVGPA